MMDFSCKKCGSVDVFIDDKGDRKALMCGDCGSWLKWVGKKEMPLVMRFINNINDSNIENKELNIFINNLNKNIQKLNIEKEELINIINKLYK